MRILFCVLILLQVATAEAAGRRIACRSFVASKMRSLPYCKLSIRERSDLNTTLMEYCNAQMLKHTDPKVEISAEKVSLAMDEVIGESCSTTTASASAASVPRRPGQPAPATMSDTSDDPATAGQ